jgi:ATP-dependent Clp protease, protease subunit
MHAIAPGNGIVRIQDMSDTKMEPMDRPLSFADAVQERLFRSRTVIISGEINQKLAANVVSQLLALSAESADTITIYLNSQGGHVESGDTIHDVIRFVKPRMRMIGTGWVASAGALIFVSVPREDRLLPAEHAVPAAPAVPAVWVAAASDIEIEAREILKMRERLNKDLRAGNRSAPGEASWMIRAGTSGWMRSRHWSMAWSAGSSTTWTTSADSVMRSSRYVLARGDARRPWSIAVRPLPPGTDESPSRSATVVPAKNAFTSAATDCQR